MCFYNVVKTIRSSKMGDKGSTSSDSAAKVLKQNLEHVYRCPVCLNLPICDIYQCNNGHLVCSDCYGKLRRLRCPTCRTPVPHPPRRNRTAEQVTVTWTYLYVKVIYYILSLRQLSFWRYHVNTKSGAAK